VNKEVNKEVLVPEVYEAVSCVGEPVVETAPLVPRLDTLDGKTICEVWGAERWKCPESFQVIREELQKKYRNVKIIPYTELTRVESLTMMGHLREKTLSDLRAGLREKGCDAAIIQYGG
jgi:hypothetical protein